MLCLGVNKTKAMSARMHADLARVTPVENGVVPPDLAVLHYVPSLGFILQVRLCWQLL